MGAGKAEVGLYVGGAIALGALALYLVSGALKGVKKAVSNVGDAAASVTDVAKQAAGFADNLITPGNPASAPIPQRKAEDYRSEQPTLRLIMTGGPWKTGNWATVGRKARFRVVRTDNLALVRCNLLVHPRSVPGRYALGGDKTLLYDPRNGDIDIELVVPDGASAAFDVMASVQGFNDSGIATVT